MGNTEHYLVSNPATEALLHYEVLEQKVLAVITSRLKIEDATPTVHTRRSSGRHLTFCRRR